jgi:hypothetical protein
MANTKRNVYHASMDEGRKRVLAIVAGILVARHLNTADDLFDSKSSPRTESLVAAAFQWDERTHPFTTADPRSNPASIFCRPV